MISINSSESILQNFKSVVEFARNYYNDNIHTEMLESIDLDSHIILEGIVSGEDDIINEATNVTDAKIIHDGKGTAISVKINGKEYRYVSATKSTAELYRSFMGMLKHANAGYKALNWLKNNSLEYYGSKNPSEEGKKLLGLDESEELVKLEATQPGDIPPSTADEEEDEEKVNEAAHDYTSTTQKFYNKANEYDIGDITDKDVLSRSSKFDKLVSKMCKSIGSGRTSCYRYAAVVASIMDRLGIKYKIYQGAADYEDGTKRKPQSQEELDSTSLINHVWIVCNGKYYDDFNKSEVVYRSKNPKPLRLKKTNSEELNEALSSYKVFRTDKTGMSYYDDFLNPRDHDYKRLAKGLQGEIVRMSPHEYLKRLGTDIFNCSYDRVLRGVDQKNVEEIANKMSSGTAYNLPILDLANKTQEGRHRALAAESLGVLRIPVLVVTKWDAHKELEMPKCMNLWYGHTIEWTRKDGTPGRVTVGLDLDKIRKKVQEIVESGDYQK